MIARRLAVPAMRQLSGGVSSLSLEFFIAFFSGPSWSPPNSPGYSPSCPRASPDQLVQRRPRMLAHPRLLPMGDVDESYSCFTEEKFSFIYSTLCVSKAGSSFRSFTTSKLAFHESATV